MRNDPRYTPSDVFETFPRPSRLNGWPRSAETLDTERREIMLRRELGLTKLYNLVNDPDITDSADPDVARMREIHVELDQAVMDAYGWGDVPLDQGSTPIGRCGGGRSARPRGWRSWIGCWPRTCRRAEAQGEAPPPADDEEEGDDE